MLFWGSKLGQQTGQQAKAQGKCTTVPDHTPCKVVPIVTLSIPSTPLSLEGLCLARSSPFVIGAAKLRFGAAKLQFEFHLKKKTSEKCGAPARQPSPCQQQAARLASAHGAPITGRRARCCHDAHGRTGPHHGAAPSACGPPPISSTRAPDHAAATRWWRCWCCRCRRSCCASSRFSVQAPQAASCR